jgi:hypothetical protein
MQIPVKCTAPVRANRGKACMLAGFRLLIYSIDSLHAARHMSIRSLVLFLYLVSGATSTTGAWACRAPPAALLIGVDAQIAAAVDVSVAQVVDAVPLAFGDVEYRFIVRERLAGVDIAGFTVLGGAPTSDGKDTAAARHTDPSFWARGGGRVWNGPDCRMHPHFSVGALYLVFRDAPATWRSFERIETVNGGIDHTDRWLEYVQAHLRQQPAGDAHRADYQRIGNFIYGFYRWVPREDLDVAPGRPLALRHAPPDLVARARALADAFDRIMRANGAVPDEEMDAALHEAAAVGAILRAPAASGLQ